MISLGINIGICAIAAMMSQAADNYPHTITFDLNGSEYQKKQIGNACGCAGTALLTRLVIPYDYNYAAPLLITLSLIFLVAAYAPFDKPMDKPSEVRRVYNMYPEKAVEVHFTPQPQRASKINVPARPEKMDEQVVRRIYSRDGTEREGELLQRLKA